MAKTIKYYKVNKLTNIDFRRVVGVTRETYTPNNSITFNLPPDS